MESGSNPHDFESAERIDVLCDAFENEYRAGRNPVIEDYVERFADPDRSNLVIELVLLDVAYRRRRGETPLVSDYVKRFPDESDPLRGCLADQAGSIDQSFESRAPQSAAARSDDGASPAVRIGRYELVERLATEGFSEVWKARDPALDRWVAVKTLRPERTFPREVVERFLDEGRKLVQLEHPCIVPVYDVGYSQDLCFVVSKLVRGETLEDVLRRQTRLCADDAAEIVLQIADAVHHAHLQGLVHRDIRPSHILLDRDGRPHLFDFGLSISAEAAQNEETTTCAYLSPEHVGDGDPVDARSDVYSLGVVLYRLVTGRTPFLGGNRFEWERQIRSLPPRPPRTIYDDIPAPLEEICLKCLNKDIEQRYPTAEQLARALDGLLRRENRHPALSSARRRILLVALVGILLILAVAAALVFWQPSTEVTQRPIPDLVVHTPLTQAIQDNLPDRFPTGGGAVQ